MDPEPDGNPGETDLRRSGYGGAGSGSSESSSGKCRSQRRRRGSDPGGNFDAGSLLSKRGVYGPGSYWCLHCEPAQGEAVAYDISAACSGFLFAVNTAHAFLGSGIYKTALVIGADTLSKIVDWSDRSTCVLFGDGAGAAVLRVEEGEKSGIFAMKMGSDGKKGPVLSCVSRTVGNFLTNTEPQIGYTTMDGQEVFKFAVKKVPETIKELLDENGLEPKDVKHYVLHQANYRIAEAIAKRLKVSMEQIPTNMEHYGNTSGASIPLLLDELNRAGKIQKGDLLVLAGFGAGLTWGATLVRW